MTADFGYARAHTIDEAVALLAEPQVRSRVWAGGTDTMVALRSEPPTFDRVVDISQIPDLHTIALRGERLHIGACVTFREAASSPLLWQHAPLLAEACRSIGTMQIANMATIGGNVANAAVAADTIPSLVCLDAEALLASPAGPQRMPVSDLITGPNRTALAADTLITAFEWALLPADARMRFLKVGRRNALSIARLSMAAIARQQPGGQIALIRLVVGACFSRPHRATATEALLQGQPPSAALFEEAGQQLAQYMVDATGQRWSTPYKSVALAALLTETLEEVIVTPPQPAAVETR